jgi:hypothetical protein
VVRLPKRLGHALVRITIPVMKNKRLLTGHPAMTKRHHGADVVIRREGIRPLYFPK